MKLYRGVIIASMTFGLSVAAGAAPVDVFDLEDDNGNPLFTDTNNDGPLNDTYASYAGLTDSNGTDDSSVATLLFEHAGFSERNSFGIFNYQDPNEKLTIFDGADDPSYQGTKIFFDLDAGLATVNQGASNEASASIGSQFGFFLQRDEIVHYSDAALNGGNDLAALYDVSSSSNDQFDAANLIVAFEDLEDGDRDFNDMVVGVDDVTSVPEPGTLALLGLGLAGLGLSYRRKA